MRLTARTLALLCIGLSLTLAGSLSASAETRTLKLYYIHTKERAEITFKKDGKYIKSGLDKLNRFLRDWRRNEPTKMDPQLFDIVWEAYQMVGAKDYIHVVSAYRSPATNEMLRRTRGGQAQKSQHMYGKALDFYIPGVKLSKLREVGFKLQGGGVGYYPKSGSPFVHFDTGNVRAWPRMSRSELTRLFPDGKTLHLPPDGKPLPGYQQALAAYKARKSRGDATALDVGSRRSGGGRNLLAAIFGGGADEEEDNIEAAAPVARRTTVVKAAPPPDTQSPSALIAALAPRKTPLPQFAPRPQGTIPVAPPEQVIALAEPVAESVPVPADIPLPEPKPEDILVAAADPGLPTRRSAAEIEAALDAAADRPADADLRQTTVEALLAANRDNAAEPPAPSPVPLPSAAPRPQTAERAPVELAALARPVPRDDVNAGIPVSAAYAPAPNPRPRPSEPDRTAVASLPVPDDPRALAMLDTGVATTGKTARPALREASARDARKPVEIVPADQIDPARFGSWTTAQLSVTDYGRPSERPVFIRNALREAPTTVYTEGFRREAMPDPRRFSGNAVTFLTVAKFGGGTGGDGQPLTLQIPPAE
ncbi:DUF882 domain-containing protein [Oricola thermophila]|uniref:DUF882 domain-containing protein n=1 Tax=Oricola thermophila TaxID=2742145 RepID=UPI001FE9D9F6|nr:DUF882 domain-containing protein [Oricola thermophila]